MRLISFLDLVCCGFGAAVLLFLLAVEASTPARQQSAGATVFVQCRHTGGPRAEVGIEFRRPGGREWEQAGRRPDGGVFLAARSETDTGADAVLILLEPTSGRWQFRPYLVDFPRGPHQSQPVRVRVDVRGEKIRIVEPARDSKLQRPGDTGQVILVEVLPRQGDRIP